MGLNDAALVDGALLAVGDDGDVFRAALQCPPTPQVPTVLQSGTTLCTAYRPQMQWYLDGEPLPDGTGSCIIANAPGNYTVVVTDALGCVSAPSAPVPIISTAVDEHATDAFAGFPNPTGGAITLSFATDGAHALLLCDAQGRVLRSERVTGARATLTLADLPRGLYLLREAGSAGAVRVVKE